MRMLKNCTIYNTEQSNWNNFTAKKYNEVSNFECWAMRRALKTIGLEDTRDRNCWYWDNGTLCQEFVKNSHVHELFKLCLTDNGILFVEYYEYNEAEQDLAKKSQFVLDLDL